MITYTQKDKYTLHIKVPYALREEFKREFPDARWNPDPDVKAWRLFSNAVIMERLDQFISTMTRPAKSAAKLEALEFTYAEIKDLELRSIQLDAQIQVRIEEFESQDAMIAKRDRMIAERDRIERAFHIKSQAFEARMAEAKVRLRQFEKEVRNILGPLGVFEDIECMKQSWENYSGGLQYYDMSELKSDFCEAQESLKDSYSDILENYGMGLDTLLELAAIDWENRRGPQPHVVAKGLYQKVKYAPASSVAMR